MVRRVASFLVLGLLLITDAYAQLASQTALVGTVSDAGGLVLPGASVVAVNVGTRDTYEATTNAEGDYYIQFVKPGKYEISVTVNGFQTFKATGVDVASNQVVRTNAAMQVGGVNESVTVESRAQVLDTDRATVSETIGQRAIVELPLSGRNVWSLASTTPGVLGGLNSDIGLSFRGAGQREIQNSLSLDGINTSANLLAATSMRPIADAVTEIQVQTGSTSAEYGSYLGVHINVVTKSGSNTPHGSLFYFAQDDALDARGHFENRAIPANPRNRKQFGAQFDGPLFIPKFYDGRNRTFFMGAYEGVRGEAITSPFASVPTALMRQGNFSEVSTQIRNPFTGEPYPGNIIPTSQLSANVAEAPAVLPGGKPDRHPSNNWQGPSPNTDNVDQFLGRVDQNIGNKIRLNLRYNWHDSFGRNVFNAAIPATQVTQPRVNNNWLGGYTHTLKPNLLNDFRIGYHRRQLRHAQSFRGRRTFRRRLVARHPGIRRRREVQQPRAAEHQHQQLLRARRGRHQLVSIRHDVPDVQRARRTRLASTIFVPASICGDSRPAAGPRTIHAGCSASPTTSPATRWRLSCSASRAR